MPKGRTTVIKSEMVYDKSNQKERIFKLKVENNFVVKSSFFQTFNNELWMESEQLQNILISKYVVSNCL